MATRSMIGLQAEDGTIEAIYCHYDGYPEYQLHTLRKHFSTPEKVKELMKGGDISSLWSEHNWERQPKEAGPLYYNDRGEETSSRFYNSVGEYSLGAYDCCCEWVYYIDQGGNWNHHQCTSYGEEGSTFVCPQTWELLRTEA